MRVATDTLLRYLSMLENIPTFPQTRSTKELQDRLNSINPDFAVDLRTIQRDLEKLSAIYPLSCETHGRSKYWFWADKAALVQLPAMSMDTALALRLAQDHLSALMPPSTLELLAPYFKRAQDILDDTSLSRWQQKVRIVRTGPPLKLPTIKTDVQEVIYQALLEERRFEATYTPRDETSKTYPINPLGLVSKNGILYLVATALEYDDIRQFALHRFKKAKLLNQRAKKPKGFNLDHYINELSEFEYPLSTKPCRLKATISKELAFLLEERPLSSNQKITRNKGSKFSLQATVKDTLELRWWLAGQGDAIQVLSPASLTH